MFFREVTALEKRRTGGYTAGLLLSYIIFGSIGIFVKYIPLASSVIAAVRGICGALFIFIFMALSKKRINTREVGSNLAFLLLSGLAIGFNWIFLFEAYRYTTIATATLCYYMAPVFVVVASPIILKERLTAKSIICILVAVIGMFFVSDVMTGGAELRGILFGLAAALLYAVCILCNKKMGKIAAETRALAQLLVAGVTVLPYALFTADLSEAALDVRAIILLAVVGIVHTGFAYIINLGSVAKVPAGTVAVLSYTDPIVAILLESVLTLTLPKINVMIGAALILGATAVSSLQKRWK